MAKDMVGGMISLCDNALKDASGGRKEVIESYKLVLETKREELSKEDLSPNERKEITDEMLKIAEKIDSVNDKHHIFVKDILKGVGNTVFGVAVIGIAILGAIDNKKK